VPARPWFSPPQAALRPPSAALANAHASVGQKSGNWVVLSVLQQRAGDGESASEPAWSGGRSTRPMRLIAPCAWQCGHPGELCTSYKQTPENHGVLKTRKLLSGATPANSLPNTSLRQQVQACATFSRQAHGKQYKPAPALQGKPCCRLACRLHVESKNLPTYLLTPAQCRAYHQRRSRAPYASAVLKTLLPATTLCQFPARQFAGRHAHGAPPSPPPRRRPTRS